MRLLRLAWRVIRLARSDRLNPVRRHVDIASLPKRRAWTRGTRTDVAGSNIDEPAKTGDGRRHAQTPGGRIGYLTARLIVITITRVGLPANSWFAEGLDAL